MHITSISLIIFTIFVQSAVGLVIVSEFSRYRRDEDEKRLMAASLPLALMITLIGLVASTTHLASPLSAVFIFNNVFSSALSLEILCAMLFLCALVLTIYFRYRKPDAYCYLGMLAMVFGLLLVWSIANVYVKRTIPTFYTQGTLLAFLGTTFSIGAALGTVVYAFTSKKYFVAYGNMSRLPMVFIGFGLLGIGLSYLGTPFNTYARSFVSSYGVSGLDSFMATGQCPTVLITSIFLPVLGLLFLIYGWFGYCQGRDGFHFRTYSLLALLGIGIGELCGRYVFYESYLRIGV